MADAWGVMPEDAARRLASLEWGNRTNLRARLAGDRPFPISLSLRPPTGSQAIADVTRFRAFVEAWRNHPLAHLVVFEDRGMRDFQNQQVPVRLELQALDELARLLGSEAQVSLDGLQGKLARLSEVAPAARQEGIRKLADIDDLPRDDFEQLVALLTQLSRGMAAGGYLRSLPLVGVGTKFLEQHETLVAGFLAALHPADAIDSLGAWLGASPTPTGSLIVRILDPILASAFCHATTFWVSSAELRRMHLPARRLIVVENMQSALALPAAEQTIAIGSSGRDLSWLDPAWTAGRSCVYWGDLDTWGFHLLDVARRQHPDLPSMMMDIATLEAHGTRSREPASYGGEIGTFLSAAEIAALDVLLSAPADQNRLEQEKLSGAWIQAAVEQWLRNT